jgi:ABC-type nitrate/sulfonate/bicarbonate transport system permease component
MKKNGRWGYPLLFVLVFLLFWEAAVRVKGTPPWLLPSPLRIVSALFEVLPLLLDHTRYTLAATLLGFVLAVTVAVALSVLMEICRPLRQGLYPLLVFSQTVPIIFVAPLFVIWFGYQLLPKVVVVALVCFFPVAVSLTDGLDNTDRALVNLLKTMGASPLTILRKARWPAALPHFFSGLRVAATYSVLGAVIGEWVGGSRGLGVFMTRSYKSFLADRVFAAIIIVSALSIALFGLVNVAARLSQPWKHRKGYEGW